WSAPSPPLRPNGLVDEKPVVASHLEIVPGLDGPGFIGKRAGADGVIGDACSRVTWTPRHARDLHREPLAPDVSGEALGVVHVLEETDLHPVADGGRGWSARPSRGCAPFGRRRLLPIACTAARHGCLGLRRLGACFGPSGPRLAPRRTVGDGGR